MKIVAEDDVCSVLVEPKQLKIRTREVLLDWGFCWIRYSRSRCLCWLVREYRAGQMVRLHCLPL